MKNNSGVYNAREAILNLLSDAEIAKVSTEEGMSTLTEGQEFVDLDHLELGAQSAKVLMPIKMGQVLPRHAVSDETWAKVVAQLGKH